jgi:hypothetical protein
VLPRETFLCKVKKARPLLCPDMLHQAKLTLSLVSGAAGAAECRDNSSPWTVPAPDG